ncbi:hypothetical protein JCM3765_001958 [Sporobolomyces pararoseus]
MSDRAAESSPLLLTPSTSTVSPSSTNPFFPPPHLEPDPPPPPPLQDQKTHYERSVLGFYLFSIASEVWVITTGTLFLPVVLETYARSNGRLGPNFESPCPASGEVIEEDGQQVAARCSVKILFTWWLDTASFSLIVYSTSVALQALTVISIGVLADDARVRHRLLISFAIIGSLASLVFLILPSNSILWPFCSLLAIVANVSFGVTGVCLNSYLPSLVRLSPKISTAQQKTFESLHHDENDPQEHFSSSSFSSSLLPTRSTRFSSTETREEEEEEFSDSQTITTRRANYYSEVYSNLKSLETSKISSRAIAIGYAAGISILLLILPLVNYLTKEMEAGGGGGKMMIDQTWPLRVAITVSGVWWLVVSLIASRFLGPNLDSTQQSDFSIRQDHRLMMMRGEEVVDSVKKSWKGLEKTLREWRKLPNTFIFLSAWFLLSDSFATLTSTAMLFAKTTLNLPTSSLIIVAILTPLSGILGSLLFPFLQSNHYLPSPLTSSNLSILILLISLSTLIPLWGLISLNSSLQLYLLSILFGSLYGSFQSFSRTCFSELIPQNQTGRWFGLYSITDKSSSFLGPLLVSIITNSTGQIRHGFYLILIFFVSSIPILLKVDMERGTKDADEFEKASSEDQDQEER